MVMIFTKKMPSSPFKTHSGIEDENCQSFVFILKLQSCHSCLQTRDCDEDPTSSKWESQLDSDVLDIA